MEENERTNIRQRQAEGIAAAKARGVRLGRPPHPLPENFHSAYQRWKGGAITGTAAKERGIPLAAFRCRAELYEKVKIAAKGAYLQESTLSCKYAPIFIS